jgi:hypothetical protein
MKKSLFLFLCLTFLTGCGAKFVYNNLAMITPWYVDDYIDLTREQKALYKSHLDEIHLWHRQQELPEYHRLLSELRVHLDNDNLDRTFLASHLLALRLRWQVLIERATPALTHMATTLSDDQLKGLMQALEDANTERMKEQDTPEEHRQEVTNSIKRWLGTLSHDQQRLIETFADRHPDRSEVTVAAHRAFQTQLRDALERRSEKDFPNIFADLIADPLNTPQGEALTLLRMQAMQDRISLYMDLWERANDTQKDKVKRRLDDVIEDLDVLIKRKPS